MLLVDNGIWSRKTVSYKSARLKFRDKVDFGNKKI